ncbi:Polypeptide N-acetylgalactosaminyltransferase 4 [Bulinus truncatus]|nr:Polypeptide N-acetylgalactosaminyltransferase 4 [Bulinus truncatus]
MLLWFVHRSPAALLKEVILVDDGSTVNWLQPPSLERYLSVLTKVRVLRPSTQMGLTKARMRGVEAMTGDVAVFLHASCECTEGWLPPLLARVQADNATLAVPVVDKIDAHTMHEFRHIPGEYDMDIPKSADEKILCPVIADGIFAVHSRTFLGQGGYDDTLEGADVGHIDLSMKTWMCAGKIELVLCSHVGYLQPMARSLTDDELDSSYSTDRILVSEKWLGEYKKFVLERLPTLPLEAEQTDQSLNYESPKCHSFQWFINNVEPALLMDGGVILKRGKLTHVAFNETVLIVAVKDAEVHLLDWYVRPTTIWYLMESGQLKTVDNVCIVAKLNKSGRKSKKLIPRLTPTQDMGYLQKIPDFLKSSNILFKHAAIPQEIKTAADLMDMEIIPDQQQPQGRRLHSYFKDLQPMKDTEAANDNTENFPEPDNRLHIDYDYQLNKVNKNFDFLRLPHPTSQSHGKMIQQGSDQHQVSSPQAKIKVDLKSVHFKKSSKNAAGVKLFPCDSKLGKWNQWTFTETGAVRHVKYNLCLSVHKGAYYELQLQECDEVVWPDMGIAKKNLPLALNEMLSAGELWPLNEGLSAGELWSLNKCVECWRVVAPE